MNDEVIKKALAKDNPVIRKYVARLISDTTGIPYEEIEGKLELLYPEVSVNKNVVNSEVDLVFKEGYTYFNIEINYGRSSSLKNKNYTYALQLGLRDIKNAKEYNKGNKVVQININAFDPYGYGELVYKSRMLVEKYNIIHNDLITIYDLNLDYFEKIPYNEIERERLLKDLAIFVVEEKEVLSNLYEGDEIMEEMKQEMDHYLNPLDSILFYNKEDLQRQIEEEMAEKGWNKGHQDGFQDGFKDGKMESKIEIAKKLLPKMTLEEIADITELSIEEIKNLKQNESM